ncbi:MAG: TrkH family potassium uptake protein [Rhizobiaceae bacterium]
MLAPMAIDLYSNNSSWQGFAFSSLMVGGAGCAVALATRGNTPTVSARFGFLLVNLLWLTLAVGGAVPFMASALKMSVTDAFFESVSGITTTGSTVISGLDHAPPGVLLWRSVLNFIGGLGVIAIGLFILPFLNIGGVSYFKIESSDIEDRPFERFGTYMRSLVALFTLLVAACAASYAFAGMGLFDAANHAMATLATGGFSTHDTSFARYATNPAVLWIAVVFMILGSLPFSILLLFAFRGRREALRDPQIKVFLGYCVVLVVALSVYVRQHDGVPYFQALTQAAFNLVSIITTTGFATTDYTLWGPFAVTAFFIATFLGGCSGSTTGGIKAYRFLILFEMLSSGLRQLLYPHVVYPIRYGERSVDPDMQRAVVLFIAAFFVIWGAVTLLLAATGLELVTALSGALTALTNVGPGLGSIIGPAGNFSTLPDVAKWICSVAMLLGRLEILAVMVVFTPVFWRG